MNVVGRERELSEKMPRWNRLFSYHFLDLIYKSEILDIVEKEKHENIHCRTRTT